MHEAIRPHFKAEFAKGLCSTTSPADEFLFGGDTAKRVKEMAELNKHKVCRGPTTTGFQGRGQRYHPYSVRGSRGGASRGRNFRSQGAHHQLQRQNFQHAPQPERKTINQKPNRNWYVDLLTDIKSLISKQSPFTAGNTRNFVSAWNELTADPGIMDNVQHCHIEFTDDPSLYSRPGQQRHNISVEVNKLLELAVISKSVHACSRRVYLSNFCCAKTRWFVKVNF